MDKIKNNIRTSRRNRKQQNLTTYKKHQISWENYDKLNKPKISFNPSEEEREKLVILFEANPKKLSPSERELRKQLEKKFTSEFIRSYERFRRKDKSKVQYEISDKELKYAKIVAISCILKNVTPYQIFEYWSKRMKNYVNKELRIPSLSFLSQPANIDEVNIRMLDEKSEDRSVKYLNVLNTYDFTKLHPKLRKQLMGYGFDLSEIDDTGLTVIQLHAIDLTFNTIEIWMIPNKLRKLVRWTAWILNHDILSNAEYKILKN